MGTTLLAIGLSVLISWGWNEVTTPKQEAICTVDVIQDGQTIHVPHKCSEVLKGVNNEQVHH